MGNAGLSKDFLEGYHISILMEWVWDSFSTFDVNNNYYEIIHQLIAYEREYTNYFF